MKIPDSQDKPNPKPDPKPQGPQSLESESPKDQQESNSANCNSTKKEKWSIGDKVNLGQLIVNVIIMLAALGAFLYGYAQFELAKKAIDDAEKSATKADSLNQERFKAEFKTILDIYGLEVAVFASNKPVVYNYTIKGVGKGILKITSIDFRSYQFQVQPYTQSILDTLMGWVNRPIHGTVSEGSPFMGRYVTTDTLDPLDYKLVVGKKSNLYLFGEIEYENEITGEKMIYLFADKILNPEKGLINGKYTERDILLNENQRRFKIISKHKH